MRVLLSIILSLASATPGFDRPGPCTTERLRGAATTISDALATSWVGAFARLNPGSRISLIRPSGPPIGASNAGLAAFLGGRADFAFVTRDISEPDLATFRAAHDGDDPIVIPVASGAWDRFGYLDAVVIVVNANNPVRRLSYRQLDGIFSASRLRGSRPLRRWSDLGVVMWRDRPVHVVGGEAWSGEESARALTVRRCVLSVGARRGVWLPVPGSGSEAEVVDRVAADPLGIGFTGMGHVKTGVRVVPIAREDRETAYRPTPFSIAKDRYPLARTVDLLIAPKSACASELRSFAQFVVGATGQNLVVSSEFLPLPANLRAKASRQARSLK
ncbi:MAG: substrate-binding domain-containing protein [Proteobacteria bacterium]|nr:substrate-binding domain-containing protein [Pseudomonadota bacterium]